MKNFKTIMGAIALCGLLFTSCSKDEDRPMDDAEKGTISFNAIVNDLANKNATKQSQNSNLPQCSDAVPAYVNVVLSRNGSPVVGSSNEPFRVNLVSNQVFTEEVPELELQPGTYSLDHFMVFDAGGNLIWVAPTGGPMAKFVDSPLPMNIELGAGVKKYVDVSVLCFDNRDVNEYGYQFFELDTNQAIEFCLFGNYCDSTGRHFAAEYSVDVWKYSNGQRGEQLYADMENVVEENAAGDMAASPLCVFLPDGQGTDEYYFEVTLMDGEDYNTTPRMVRKGVITDGEVRSFFDGENNMEYYHFRTGCENNDNVPVLRDPQDDAEFYKAYLSELNNSDATGFAYLRLDGNILETTILAYGTTPNRIHPQHIHGFADDHNSTCPDEDADTNNNGIISLAEGVPFYGGVLLQLMQENGSWPMANSWGMYAYNRTFTLGSGETISADNLMPLEKRAIVLHGAFVEDGDDDGTDPDYNATLPIACGQVWQLDI